MRNIEEYVTGVVAAGYFLSVVRASSVSVGEYLHQRGPDGSWKRWKE